MYKGSKRLRAIPTPVFSSNEDSISFVKDNATAKFNETISLYLKLGMNPKKTNENVRGSAILEYGLPKKLKVMVFANSEKAKDALKHGAAEAGLDELIDQIRNSGVVNADVCLATPDVFQKLIPIAKILGQAGKMPNNKDGTVTTNIEDALKNILGGNKVSFRNDSEAYVQIPVGKASFSIDQIKTNIKIILNSILSFKINEKKEFIQSVKLASTMGKSVDLKYKDLMKN